MPDYFPPKIKPQLDSDIPAARRSTVDYAELQAVSNFSFLTGASHPEEIVRKARSLDMRAIGLCDLHSFAGIVRAHKAAREIGIPFHPGAQLRVELESGKCISVLCYPCSLSGYQRLSALLSLGKRRSEENGSIIYRDEFLASMQDVHCIFVPPYFLHHSSLFSAKQSGNLQLSSDLSTEAFERELCFIRDNFHDRGLLSLAIVRNYGRENSAYLEYVTALAKRLSIALLATNDVHYHDQKRKELQDVLTCIKHKCSLESAGYLLFQNSDRCLKSPEEMARIFRDQPAALRRSMEISEALQGFSLSDLRYQYPHEVCPEGLSPLEYLKDCSYKGAKERYGEEVPKKVQKLLTEEFQLIDELNYSKYFLTCYDIVKFARSKGILCQGRGAAANSVVCYCLGITAVDPTEVDLLFARFVSKERNEPPDIDIDFEHERREEVIQYIYERFGRRRAALTAEVVTYRHRSAIREVAKALGFSLEMTDRIAKSLHRWTSCEIDAAELKALGLNPEEHKTQLLFSLSNELLSFPRHLSQHVGGFIISEEPLDEIVPIMNASMPGRTIIEWDKDDIEELGMLKIDVLALGMLTCIRKALKLINHSRKRQQLSSIEFHQIPAEDSAVYDMICKADTVGVFQIESRAQMSMLPRLRPRTYYDLVIEVAIVRPGPIQGDMVHPFLRRRKGLEKARYPDKVVEGILGKTLGVPIFQEQAMRLAIALAGFSPGEAEQLRRAMAAWKRNDQVIATFKERIIRGMINKGYSSDFAESVMKQIRGFSEYGFPESHAASFALLVYASCWQKCFYPAEFCAALLNSQPMGFYAPSQLIQDAQRHGVLVLPIDIQKSSWDCQIEYSKQAAAIVRLGTRLVKSLSQLQAKAIERVQTKQRYRSLQELWAACCESPIPIYKSSLVALARADALRSLGLSRREALWEIEALPEKLLPMDAAFQNSQLNSDSQMTLPLASKKQDTFLDYSATALSLKAHPMTFLREGLAKRRCSTALELKASSKSRTKTRCRVAGLAIFRQRPGTAKGVVFVSLEDETGIANLIVRPKIFEKYRKTVLHSSSLFAEGILESVDEVVYVMAEKLQSIDDELLSEDYQGNPERELSLKSHSY